MKAGIWLRANIDQKLNFISVEKFDKLLYGTSTIPYGIDGNSRYEALPCHLYNILLHAVILKVVSRLEQVYQPRR